MEAEEIIPSTSRQDEEDNRDDGYDEDDEASIADDYLEIFDADQFLRDGNDIRFQLPSNNAALTLSHNIDDVQKKSLSLKRRKTTRAAIVRRKSTRPPPVDRSSKPMISLRQEGLDYDEVDRQAGEDESLVTGEEQLNELQNVRGMTLPMGQKRHYRDRLKSIVIHQPSGLTLAKYQATKKWLKMRKNMKEVSHYADIWRGTLKEIEGQFGAGIMEYFKLVKWMIFLNLLLCVPMLFIIIPQATMYPYEFENRFVNMSSSGFAAGIIQSASSNNGSTTSTTTASYDTSGGDAKTQAERLQQLNSLTYDHELSRNCSLEYKDRYMEPEMWYQYLLDFIQGTGWFEHTPLFYGYYFNKTSGIGNTSGTGNEVVYPWYNLSVAYIVSTLCVFVISLLFIVISTSSGLENNVLADQVVYYKSINQIFAGWDFGLYKEKSSRVKKSLIRHEIIRDLAERRRSEKYHNRSTSSRIKIYAIRVVVNTIVIVILVGCAAAVYFAQTESDQQLAGGNTAASTRDESLQAFTDLIWQYLPSVLITVMYAVFPILFKKLAQLERYYPATEQNVTIARIVLLRLGTVFLLLYPIYMKVLTCNMGKELQNGCGYCDNIYCWETFIGQQLYKLVLLDFFVIVGVVFFVEFPRKLIWNKYQHVWIVKSIGQEEFDIPVNVIDMVYTQTLCWIGSFYSPLLPFITLFKVIVFFFVRKLSLFRNQQPATAPYRASSMNLFFKVVLTVAFFMAILAVGITIGVIPPSRTCGPFRTHSSINKMRNNSPDEPYTMFGAVAEALLLLPEFPRDVISFLGSAPFLSALIVTLLLLIYLYAARGTGQSRLVELLRETLKREEKDKHWLLSKVNNTLKRELSTKPNTPNAALINY